MQGGAAKSSYSQQASRSFMQKRALKTTLKCARLADRRRRKQANSTILLLAASCGKEAKVPFKPHDDRPVYCSECFAKMKEE